MARLYKRLDRPVLTDVALRFSGVDVTAMEPERLPDLFAGQPLVVVGKIPRQRAAPASRSPASWAESRIARTIPVVARRRRRATPVLGTLWARRRIETLTDATEGGAAATSRRRSWTWR